MNQYVNEEVMWQRLRDIQREAENRRLFSQHALPRAGAILGIFARRAWWLAGLATRRAPRRRPMHLVDGSVSDRVA